MNEERTTGIVNDTKNDGNCQRHKEHINGHLTKRTYP